MQVHAILLVIQGVTHRAFEKRLTPRERDEDEAIARLRAEGALLEALDRRAGNDDASRVTPALLERGEDAGGPWLRTAALPFPTLADRVAAAASPLPAAWVEAASHAAFDALARLHDARDARGPLGVVHADLSPSNVAVDDDASRVVFLDLELARWRDAPPPPRDGAFRGTVAYTAPEIARGEEPTTAGDRFSLAATLLFAAMGRPPRAHAHAPSFPAMLAAAAEVPLVETLPPAVRATLDGGATRKDGYAKILAALAHDPAARSLPISPATR